MTNLRLLCSLFVLTSLMACGVDDSSLANGRDDTTSTGDALSTKGRFETFVGADGKTYFHLLAGNGEKVLGSQGYTTLESAKTGIASVKTNGQDTNHFLLREASDGAWYFVLTAGNGAIIGTSEMYASQSNATRGMNDTASVVKATVEQDAAKTNAAKFDIFKGLDTKYYFDVRAQNGEIVLQSQSYTSKQSATTGVNSVNLNGSNVDNYEVLPAADGTFYFVLRAGNGAIIGRSETFPSKSNAQRAVSGITELLTAPLPR